MSVTVAVDTTGADLGPAEVAAGAVIAAAQGSRSACTAQRKSCDRWSPASPGSPWSTRRSRSPRRDPALAVRSNPDASIVQVVRAVAAGEADAFVVPAPPVPRSPRG